MPEWIGPLRMKREEMKKRNENPNEWISCEIMKRENQSFVFVTFLFSFLSFTFCFHHWKEKKQKFGMLKMWIFCVVSSLFISHSFPCIISDYSTFSLISYFSLFSNFEWKKRMKGVFFSFSKNENNKMILITSLYIDVFNLINE